MGTWRYTLADNICEYDDNAQRLYGLSEARFLHDETGVKDMIHPDDMETMWARVAKALDPKGDGRYEVDRPERWWDEPSTASRAVRWRGTERPSVTGSPGCGTG